MPFPRYQDVEEALLCLIYFNGGPYYQLLSTETYKPLADYFNLSKQERSVGRLFKDGRYEPKWNNMVQWARRQLKKAGYIDTSAPRAVWKLSEKGVLTAYGICRKYSTLKPAQDPPSKLKPQTPIQPLAEDAKTLPDIEELNISVKEGGRKLITHLRRERNPQIIDAKKAQVLRAAGALKCEICRFDFVEKYGRLGQGFCEAHHKIPLSESDREIETRLEDLAILCSNCHRMIHRTKPMISVDEFRERLRKRK